MGARVMSLVAMTGVPSASSSLTAAVESRVAPTDVMVTMSGAPSGDVKTFLRSASTASATSFGEIFSVVFGGTYSCGNGYCHGGGTGGFQVSDATLTHFNLVNQSAVSPVCGLTQLVVPGDPESSILWRSVRPVDLDGGDTCAPKMPQGSDGMAEADAQLVYDWIADGALP